MPCRASQRTDEELFLAYQTNSDCHALSVLFRRRVDELLRLALFLTECPSDAEDLVQATFVSAIAGADTFHRDGRVMAWLCGILTNHARMLRRAARRRPPEILRELPADADPMRTALHAELRGMLDEAISGLSEPYRSVLRLYLDEGLDSREISRRLDRPRATVRKQMQRAIDRLRVALPMGLATALVARMNPAQIAADAADVARFVDPVAVPDTEGGLPVGGARTRWLRLSAGVGIAFLFTLALGVFLGEPAMAVPPTSSSLRVAIAERDPVVEQVEPDTGGRTVRARSPTRSESGAVLRLQAVDRSGSPRQGVDLLLALCDGRPLPERLFGAAPARTGSDGFAIWTQLRPGPVEVGLPGGVPRHRIVLGSGVTTERIVLSPPVRIAGRVIGRDRQPIAGAEIVVTETLCRGDPGVVVARTDAQGRFAAVVDLEAGKIFARHERFTRSSTARLQSDSELELVMEPARRLLDVRVVGPTGARVPDCYVALAPRSPRTRELPSQHGRTDRDGRFRFHDPGTEAASVVAIPRGGAPVVVAVPADANSVDVRLGRGGSVHGVVVDPEGRPVAGRVVSAGLVTGYDNDPVSPLTSQTTRTSRDGTFSFSALPVGRVRVRLLDSGEEDRLLPFLNQFVLAGSELELSEGDSREVRLALRSCDELEGQVVSSSGRPLAGWHVVAVPENGVGLHRIGRARWARSASDGTFAVPEVADGEVYRVGVFPPDAEQTGGSRFPLVAVSCVAGDGRATLVVPDGFAADGRLRLRVLAPNGRGAAFVAVELTRTDFGFPITRRTDALGAVAFASLTPGRYRLAIADPREGTKTLEVEVPPHLAVVDLGAVVLEEACRPSVSLHAPVADLSGIRVVARTQAGGKFVGARTGANGVARLGPIPPGTGTLLVHGPGIVPREVPVELRSGRQEIHVDVQAGSAVSMRFSFDPVENPFVIAGPLWVEIFDAKGRRILADGTAVTQEHGAFGFDTGLAPGRYRARAATIWNATASVEFEVGGEAKTEVDARLVP